MKHIFGVLRTMKALKSLNDLINFLKSYEPKMVGNQIYTLQMIEINFNQICEVTHTNLQNVVGVDIK